MKLKYNFTTFLKNTGSLLNNNILQDKNKAVCTTLCSSFFICCCDASPDYKWQVCS